MTASSTSSSDARFVRLFAPVDIGFLAFFRIYFGAMMLWDLWDFYAAGLIETTYVKPAFHFTYYGFSWVHPWPGNGMVWHFAGLAILAIFVMLGLFYRASAVLLWLGFTYVFLLEKAVYLNHYYLICLFCFVLIFLPADRAGSIDARLWPRIKSGFVPAWTLWLLRFQVALPYVFGGIAKLNADWLRGEPMEIWLPKSVWHVLLGPIVEQTWFALAFSWGGLVFDLGIVPLLMWQRTRLLAFGVAVAFHLMNAFMFRIGIFPWLMIGATTVFFAPDWPRRVLPSLPRPAMNVALGGGNGRQKPIVIALALFVAVQVLLPFRFWLYPGNALWTDEGMLFSWHMMVRHKENAVRFLVIDAASGKVTQADLLHWLSPQQVESMGHDPEMMREFAQYLRGKYEADGAKVEIRVFALCALNGRRPQLLVNPNVDLSGQPRTLLHQVYIVPLREPFRRPPCQVPVADWEAELMNPREQ